MTAADLPLLARLRAQAGWNQTEADLSRYLDLQGDGGLVAELDGVPVATTMTFVFGRVAWVAMVLVEESVRGRGVGTAIMRAALAHLDGRGVPCVRLDATPLGRPVYEKLGFFAQFTLHRYEGTPPAGAVTGAAEPMRPEDWPDVLALDRDVTGADRVALLDRLRGEFPDSFRVVRAGGAVAGFVAARPGRNAALVGPCLTRSPAAGEALLAGACARHAGQPLFVDIPEDNRGAVALAGRLGLRVQRPLLRMARGEPVNDLVGMLWASSGPAMG